MEPGYRFAVAGLDELGEHRSGRDVDVGHRALEPGDLRTGGREIHMRELLLERDSDGIGIRERISGPRVAASRAHEGENAQCLVVRPGRLSRVGDDRAGIPDRVVPAPAIEGPAGGDGLHVDAPHVLRVLGAVLDRVVDVPLDEVVAVPGHRDG